MSTPGEGPPPLDDEGLPTGPPGPPDLSPHETPSPGEARSGDEPAEPEEPQPEEPEPAAEPEEPEERRRPALLVATAAGLAVLSLALGILAAVLAARLDDDRSQRDAVEEVSGRFATALLTYDYTDLEAAKGRVLALSTRKFRREYEAAFTGGLDVLVRETQARSAGTVTEIFVGEIEGDSATTIAVVDAVSRGAQGPNRVLSSYIQLDLVRLQGRWLVDNVTNLNFAQAASPTITTTAPR